jgi:O-antigen/teichoic acid export membrane protein
MEDAEAATRRLAGGAATSVSGKIIGRVLAVVLDIIVARVLGPAVFGAYAISWTLIRTLGLLVHLGLPNAMLRYIPILARDDPPAVRPLILRAVSTALLVAGAAGALVSVLAAWLAEDVYLKPELTVLFRVLAWSLPTMAVLAVAAAILRSAGHMRESILTEDVGQPLAALILLVSMFIAMGPSLGGVMAANVLSYLAAATGAWFIVRHLFRYSLAMAAPAALRFREVLRYALPTSIAGALAVFVFWVDRLLVGYFLPVHDNGLYQAASQLSLVFVLILAAFNAILGPIFSESHAHQRLKQMGEAFRVGTKWGLYMSIPIFLVISFAPQEVLALVFGAAYADAWVALVVLSLGQIVNVGTGSVGTLLMMTGHQQAWMRLSISSLLLNIVLCLLLIPRLGIMGGALSTAISLNLVYILAVLRARRLLGVWPYDRRYLKGMAATAISVAALILTRALYAGPSWGYLLGVVFVASAAFFLALYRLGIDPEDRTLLRMALERIGRK